MRREIAKLYLPSLRGALATKQSILTLRPDGLLRFARNDVDKPQRTAHSRDPLASVRKRFAFVAGKDAESP
jgi:hypothetical protein